MEMPKKIKKKKSNLAQMVKNHEISIDNLADAVNRLCEIIEVQEEKIARMRK